MPAVHYYLGRPARVWISAHSRRSPARQARNGSGPLTDPLTDTHTGYISLISGTARRFDAYDPPVMPIGGSRALTATSERNAA